MLLNYFLVLRYLKFSHQHFHFFIRIYFIFLQASHLILNCSYSLMKGIFKYSELRYIHNGLSIWQSFHLLLDQEYLVLDSLLILA